MRGTTTILILVFMSMAVFSPAQDFIMEGCYWGCPYAEVEVDSNALHFWIDQMETKAPELSHAGFTFMGLPSLASAPKGKMNTLINELQSAGLHTFAYLNVQETADSTDHKELSGLDVNPDYPVNSFFINPPKNLSPEAVAQFLNQLALDQREPQFCLTALPENNANLLSSWINKLEQQLDPSIAENLSPRIYDFVLRDALRQACTDESYDVRNLYQQSIRDITALSGYNLVTVVNSPALNNFNQIENDWDDRIENPLLAYVYTLTNNQLGMPAVFYADYIGEESEEEDYVGKPGLNDEINQLIKAHQQYIYNSTSIEYLNHPDSDKASIYLSGDAGADSSKTLIYQLDGTNTPAGKANKNIGGKDVIVAINFADSTLKLLQEINPSNLQSGDFFTDILSQSNTTKCEVGVPNDFGLSNAIYIELPPNSYSIWVQGQASQLVTSLISLETDSYEDFVELSWNVPYEQTTLGYSIERSINKESFEEIAWVTALRSGSTEAAYLFIDDDVFPNETLHYRVKMVDQNGRFEYSTVEATMLSKLEVSFNIAEGKTHYSKAIMFSSNFENQAELTLFNADGEPILHRNHLIPKGASHTEIDLSKLPNGVYFLTFKTRDNKSWTTRFLKM